MHAGLVHIPKTQPLNQTQPVHFNFFPSWDCYSQTNNFPARIVSCQLYLREKTIFVEKHFSQHHQDGYYERCFTKCNYFDMRGTQAGKCETVYGDVDLK